MSAVIPEPAFAEGQRVRVSGGGRGQAGQAGTVIEVTPINYKGKFLGHVFRVRFGGAGGVGDTDKFSARELEALAAVPYQE